MSTSEIIFLIVGGIGLVLMLASLVLGDVLDIGHGADIPSFDAHADASNADHSFGASSHEYGTSWFSTPLICASMFGFGATGFIASFAYEAPVPLTWILACIGLVSLGVMMRKLILQPLARQQHNSMLGRQSYVGCRGTVTLTIPSDGFGQVSFRDTNGAQVNQTATSAKDELERGTPVMIIDITPSGVIVEPDPLSTKES